MSWSQISRHDRQYHADAATSAKNQKTRGPIRSVMGVPSMPSLSARSQRDTAAHTRRRSRRSDAGRRGFPVQARVDLSGARGQAPAFCRPCVDWTERRPHIGGAVGAGLANRCFELKWIERVRDSPALTITPAGRHALVEAFALSI